MVVYTSGSPKLDATPKPVVAVVVPQRCCISKTAVEESAKTPEITLSVETAVDPDSYELDPIIKSELLVIFRNLALCVPIAYPGARAYIL